jgi:cytochrome P450
LVEARSVHNKTKLGDFLSLPAGVIICLPTVLVHQDHELWGDDTLEFKPKRFSKGISKARTGQVSFFPFGWGPRICALDKTLINDFFPRRFSKGQNFAK